jgi:hypothetical protein
MPLLGSKQAKIGVSDYQSVNRGKFTSYSFLTTYKHSPIEKVAFLGGGGSSMGVRTGHIPDRTDWGGGQSFPVAVRPVSAFDLCSITLPLPISVHCAPMGVNSPQNQRAPTAGTKTPDVVSFLRRPATPVEAMKNHRRKRAFRQGLRCNMHHIKQLLISICCSHLTYATYRFLHYPQLTTEFWLTFCGTKRHYLTYSQLIADCTAATCAFHPHGN